MSWLTPVTKNAVKYGVRYGVRYGPQAKIAWDAAGKQVQSAAKAQAENLAARRTAFAEAETVLDGSVLRRVWEGRPVWVVFSGERAVSAYPTPPAPLADLLAQADLARRQTPEDYHEAQLTARAKRGARKAGQLGLQAAQVGTNAGKKAGKKAASRRHRGDG